MSDLLTVAAMLAATLLVHVAEQAPRRCQHTACPRCLRSLDIARVHVNRN